MKKFRRALSILLSVVMIAGMLTAVPFEAGAESAPPVLKEGAYVPYQAVVLFKNSAIDTDSVSYKDDLESVGASSGNMMDACGSRVEALSAAYEEVGILKRSLGDDFVL